MKIGILDVLVSLVVCGVAQSSFATEINFDDFTVVGGISNAAADRYQSLGVIFGQGMPIENVQVAEPGFLSSFINLGGSTPNEVLLNDETTRQIDLHFVIPGTGTPTTVDFVEALFMDTEVGSTLGTIQAFDTGGTLLATSTLVTPSSLGAKLSVNDPGISWVRLSVDGDGGGFDNLSFTTVPSICGSVGAFPRSTFSLASGQTNYCENWFGVSQPGQDLRGADLSMADLGSSNLAGCLLIDVDFSGANLDGASLVNVQLGGATLSGANLTAANLSFATLTGAHYNESTLFPSGLTYNGGSSGLPGNISPWDARMIPVPEPSDEMLLICGAAGLAGLWMCQKCGGVIKNFGPPTQSRPARFVSDRYENAGSV